MDNPAKPPPSDGQATDAYVPLRETAGVTSASSGTRASKPSKPAARKLTALGGFTLTAKLGAGATGTVYRARQDDTGRDAALKVLSKEMASQPDFVSRFQREARLMAKLNHPNVLRCYAVGESHGFHYLAMEFAGGGTVSSWLEKLGRFALADALCVTTGAARGLGYAHGHQMVHRDVKPDNLVFDSAGTVKVADLGLARATNEGEGLTRTGIAIGTPLYAAPEQIRNAKNADARSDIYGLGCVLYHLLTGKVPFDAKTFVDLMAVKERGTFAPLRKHRHDVPEGLDRILTRMLARFPEQRYCDCGELLDDLGLLGQVPERPSFFEEEMES